MSELHRISDGGPSPKVGVIFVHGLGGHHFDTWGRKVDNDQDFWPFWLADDLPDAAVHCLEYEASASEWLGRAMPLTDRATNLLTLLETYGIGRRPVIFICHSLGGLVVKQMLRDALGMKVPAWGTIAKQTKAVFFLATPHAGSDHATWLDRLGRLLRASPTIEDLRAHDPHLRNLNSWYRESAIGLGIATHCLFETYPTKIGKIVEPTSADPGMTGVVPRPVDADHVSICKPPSRQDLVYRFVIQQIQQHGEDRTGPATPIALNRLPADLPDFAGRQVQIAALETAFRDDGSAAISAIDGMGGVGKSALAIHVCHLLAAEIGPDGVLYVEMGGVSERPLTASDAMADVSATLDPQAPKPGDEREAVASFRRTLDGRRVLLLLDNAKDASTVAPLFEHRPSSCTILVTSRDKIVWPGVASVALEEMTPGEARKLLRTIVGRTRATDAELDEIAQRCGFLPLALRVAGSFLVQHENWPVGSYLAALANERSRLSKLKLRGLPKLDVAAVLGFSARRLAEEDRKLAERWQMLAVFVESFDLAAVAAVWQVDADQAIDGLGELVTRSMVRFDQETSRYRLHDLMRDVARLPWAAQDGAALEADLEMARARHARHYWGVLAAADELYSKVGDSVDGLMSYDLEQRNIAAGQAWSAAHIDEQDAAARLAADYASAYILAMRLHRREWIGWLEAQRQACVRLADRRGEGRALGNLGLAWAALGEVRRAIDHHEQDLAIAREIGDREGEAASLSNMGLAWSKLGEPKRAIGLYRQALKIACEIGDERHTGSVLGNLGLAWAALGELRRAIDHHEQHLAIARAIGDRRGEGNALGSLGNAWADLGDPRRAIDFHEQHLAIAREIGDRTGEGNALGSLGNAWADLGDPRQAIDFHEQHLAIAREIGDRTGEGNALGSLGNAWLALGEPRRAIGLYEQRLAIVREIGDRHGEGSVLGSLGIAWAVLGEPRQAIAFHEQHFAIAREIGNRTGEGNALGNLGNAWADLGEPRRAIDFYRRHLAIVRKIGERMAEGSALGNLGNCWLALGEPWRAINFHEQHLAIAREIGDRTGEGNALGSLGNAWLVLREPRRAIRLYEQRLAIVREIGDRMGEGSMLFNSGLVLDVLGERDEAMRRVREARVIFKAIGNEHRVEIARAQLAKWGAADERS